MLNYKLSAQCILLWVVLCKPYGKYEKKTCHVYIHTHTKKKKERKENDSKNTTTKQQQALNDNGND